MTSLTFAIPNEIKFEMKELAWVNWSELTKEEFLKKEIFERFIKTGALSKEDEEFCERIDWDPIDELEVREEYIKKLKKIEKGPHSRMTFKKLDKLMGLE